MLRSPVVWYEAAADNGGSSADSGRGAVISESDQDPNEGGDDGARSFTQDELDALFSRRAAQARGVVMTGVLEALGVESIEEAAGMLTAARTARDEEMSELEREQAARQAAEVDAEAARSEGQTAIDRANMVLMRSAVLVEAKDQGFEYPEDVWEQLDHGALTLAEDGATVQGVEQATKAVAKARPLWLKAPAIGYGTPAVRRGKTKANERGAGNLSATRRLVKF